MCKSVSCGVCVCVGDICMVGRSKVWLYNTPSSRDSCTSQRANRATGTYRTCLSHADANSTRVFYHERNTSLCRSRKLLWLKQEAGTLLWCILCTQLSHYYYSRGHVILIIAPDIFPVFNQISVQKCEQEWRQERGRSDPSS